MRVLLVFLLVSVACSSIGCQRRGVPYAGIGETQEDKGAVQPDPARAE